MHNTAQLQSLVEEGLSKLNFNAAPAELYEPVRYMLSLGGKRMRPLFVLMGCELFSDKTEKAIPPALGIELFHNFTLLHDDIMDNAPLRRGKQTVHVKWNRSTAILSGDAMFVMAYRQMMYCNDKIVKQVVDIFSRTAIEVCEGQQLDMNFEKLENISIPDYIQMITKKTAVLPAAGMQIGALCGGASAHDAEQIYEFGKNIGIAFQLQDDLLDVYGSAKFGKQTGGDIISNKKTFLYLDAIAKLDAASVQALKTLYASANFPAAEKVKAVTELFDKVQVRETAKAGMQKYYNRALGCFSRINIPEANKKTLLGFCDELMKREI